MNGISQICNGFFLIIIRHFDGLSFESLLTMKGQFKVRNSGERKMLKSLVKVMEASSGLGNLMGGWFSKKEPEVPKDKNEIKINIIQRKEKFPKVLMREGR